MNSSRGVSRRSLLRLGAASAATAVAGPALLTACSTKNTSESAAASSKVKLPTYVPFEGPTPDLPGNAKGLEPGFLTFPKSLVQSVKSAPGDGSTIHGLTEIWTTPPPPMGSNPYWKALNQKINAELNLILGTDPSYPDKFAAITAGGDLPDLMWIPPNQGITHVDELLRAKFTDLTPLLSGDAVKDYPNLGNLHESAWKTSVVNGKIWGPPIPSTAFGQVYVGNNHVWDPVGGFMFKSADDFLAKAKEVNNPKGNRWALEPYYINALHMFGQWFGVPNHWRLDKDGKLTYYIETDEYAEALAYAHKVYQAGVFYPDATLASSTTKFQQGGIGAIVSSGPNGNRATARAVDPSLKVETLVPLGHAGGKGHHDMGYGTIGFTAIKKSDEKRVRMLLRVLDFLAAPFGSDEWMFAKYGRPGVDYTRDSKGNPQATSAGKLNVQGVVSGLGTMSSPSPYIYDPNFSTDVSYDHGVEEKLLAMAWVDPTIGHYSDTYTKVGAKLTTNVYDFVNDAVSGRKPVSDLKGVISDWRSGGGDKMRSEYEKSLQAGH